MNNKKGQVAWLITILLVVVVGFMAVIGGKYMGWWMVEDETPTAGTAPADKTGDLGSLKFSARSISDATPSQIATTGYCWDNLDPTELLESSSGKTLSTTAGTSFANAYRGHSYTCTAFSSSMNCDRDTGSMGTEGLNLRSDCRNLSNGVVETTLYENDVAETVGSEGLVISGGSSKKFNKWMVEVNASYRTFPVKAVCFKTNVTTTHVSNFEVANWKSDDEPTGFTYCFSLATERVIDRSIGDQFIFPDAIMIDADATGFSNNEMINMTLMDGCEYVSTSGAIKEDYFQRDTTSKLDCGMPNPWIQFKLSS